MGNSIGVDASDVVRKVKQLIFDARNNSYKTVEFSDETVGYNVLKEAYYRFSIAGFITELSPVTRTLYVNW